jgi:oxygen-independent coproporphyrinogen-3 oxidase
MEQPAALGLYVHIPFCERKCPYCDFNTYAGLQAQFPATVAALVAELGRWAETLSGRPLTSVFMGGGTPTVLDAAQLERLFVGIHRHLSVAPGAEITCEANPGTVDRAKFATLRALGVNRLSMGVQSFQPAELGFLGRIHDVDDVYLAYAAARSAGFENVNLDFMFGLPGQTPAAWEDTLGRALELEPDHLSLYSLIVEPDTPLERWVQSGQVAAPDDDEAAELYERAMATLGKAGYVHYEVSNWARGQASDEPDESPVLASRHNLLYWRNQEYLGVGPGAHSHLRWVDEQGTRRDRRWANQRPVPAYVRHAQRSENVEESAEEIGVRAAMDETMIVGLRLVREGVPFRHFAALHGQDLREIYPQELADLQREGTIEVDDRRVRLTQRGLMIGNRVFVRFLSD